MKRMIGLVAVLVLASGLDVSAQQAPADARPGSEREIEAILDRSGLETALDSVARETGPELREALDQLTASLSAVAIRVANDPELRVAGARAAGGLVEVAQVLLEERADDLQEVLRAMAERLATVAAPASPAEPQ